MTSTTRFPVVCFVACLALPEILLGEVPEGAAPEPSRGDWPGSPPTLHSGAARSPVQPVGLQGIMHLQSARVDASQGSANEREFRRFRFGVDSRFLDHFAFRATVNFDPEGDRFYRSLSQVFVNFSPHGNEREDYERLRISAGSGDFDGRTWFAGLRTWF